MATLENCPTCGNQTSENADQCPACGEPLATGWADVIREERQQKADALKKSKRRKQMTGGAIAIGLAAFYFGPDLYQDYRLENLKEIDPTEYRQKIDDLEKQVAGVPASNFDENIRLYLQLLEFDPENKRYADKAAHYQQKKKDAEKAKVGGMAEPAVSGRVKAETKIEATIDIMRIAGKSQAVVASILGDPDRCETIKHDWVKTADKCYYGAKVNIVYVEEKADWIALFVDAPYSPKALSMIGIAPPKPTFANRHVIRWNNIENLREVSMFPKGKDTAAPKIDYIYVNVATKPT